MTDDEKRQYLNFNHFDDFNGLREFDGVKVIDKNGKTLMKGDIESLFHGKIIKNNGRYEDDQKMKTWLNNNYAQYYHNFGNKNHCQQVYSSQ